MKGIATAMVCALSVTAARATEIPQQTFYSGKDVYGFCQRDRTTALAYTAGLYDQAAYAALIIDHFRYIGDKTPQRDLDVDFHLNRIVGYCVEHATLEQVTDVFCTYLKDFPEKRDKLPQILFSEALTKAWPCPGK